MTKVIITLITILLLSTGCNNSQRNNVPSHDEMMAKATRSEKDGWILVHLEGDPQTIGYQHGYLLAEEIIDVRGAMSMLFEKETGKDWTFYRDESYRMFWRKTPVEYQEEMEGIVSGVNKKMGEGTTDIKDIVAINSNIEMAGYYVPWLDKEQKADPPEHCSAFAATGSWTKDGKIVMAHNNWSEYVLGERWNVILDIVPEKGNSVIMDAMPGLIHSGDDFNINSAGLIVTETTISGFFGFDTAGVAEFVRARKAIQYASSIDEWADIMKEKNNGGYANDWLIGDNKTGEIGRLELGLKNQFLEKSTDGYFVGANFPVHEKLRKEETTFDPEDKDASPNIRKLRWEVLMKENKGKIDVESAKAFMADHYDMRRNRDKASKFTLCGHIDEDDMGNNEISWDGAFFHAGAVQAKATDSELAGKMMFWAIMGHPCGQPFDAASYLEAHPEYSFEKEYLRDMPHREWMLAGEE